jgi:hypothetical protein
VRGTAAEDIGRTAAAVGAVIVAMRAQEHDLESIFESLIHPKELAR